MNATRKRRHDDQCSNVECRHIARRRIGEVPVFSAGAPCPKCGSVTAVIARYWS
jgi:hypothetical protein